MVALHGFKFFRGVVGEFATRIFTKNELGRFELSSGVALHTFWGLLGLSWKWFKHLGGFPKEKERSSFPEDKIIVF